ncbi:Bug family tripartite tricarboxylate transporter substrate binding protein [Bordetella sp. 2513F-2]
MFKASLTHTRRRRALLSAALASFAIGLSAQPAAAAEAAYPDRPITLVLAYPPGGAVDFVGRQLARYLESSLGQPVVVENRPGAGSIIGTNVVTRAKPDGYTLLLADPALVINPSLMKSVPYDVKRDLVAVSTVTLSPLVLAVPQNSPVKTLADLVAAGKQAKTGINFASAGLGTTPHMAGELLKLQSGADFVHIPYKGSGPAMTDLISGQVDFAFATQPAAAQYIAQGRLRGLAISGDQPSKVLPELPTIASSIPGFRVLFWTALFAPAQTPRPVLEKLSHAVEQAMTQSEMPHALEKAGENPAYMSLDQTAGFIDQESAMWTKVVSQSHIKID